MAWQQYTTVLGLDFLVADYLNWLPQTHSDADLSCIEVRELFNVTVQCNGWRTMIISGQVLGVTCLKSTELISIATRGWILSDKKWINFNV